MTDRPAGAPEPDPTDADALEDAEPLDDAVSDDTVLLDDAEAELDSETDVEREGEPDEAVDDAEAEPDDYDLAVREVSGEEVAATRGSCRRRRCRRPGEATPGAGAGQGPDRVRDRGPCPRGLLEGLRDRDGGRLRSDLPQRAVTRR